MSCRHNRSKSNLISDLLCLFFLCIKVNNGQLGALQDDSLHSRDDADIDADADVGDNDGYHIIIITSITTIIIIITNITTIIIIIITSLPAS